MEDTGEVKNNIACRVKREEELYRQKKDVGGQKNKNEATSKSFRQLNKIGKKIKEVVI